jgi:O-antigen/teichoic acid export membrane protein
MTLTILRTQGRAFAYTVVSAGTLALNAVIAVILLTTWRRDSAAVVYALAASLLLGALLGLGLAGRSVLGRPSMPLSRNLLRLGLPLAPAVAATWLAEFANRAILLDRAGAEQLGYLSVALRFGSIAGLAVIGFQLAWQPLAFSLGTGREALERIGLDARRILVVVSMVVVAVAAGSREGIALLSGPGYAGALEVVGLALVGQLFTAVFLVASMPSALARSMGQLGIAGIVGVAAAVAVNLVVAAPYGAQGTAAALAIGPLVSAATAWALGRTRLHMPIAGAAVALVVGSAATFAIVVTTVDAFASPWLRIVALLVFGGVLAVDGTAAEILRYVRARLAR